MDIRYLFINQTMKLSELKSLIKESVKKALAEGNPAYGTLTVKNASQANLYNAEILGQLSDGAWENARPSSHWLRWHDTNVVVGSPIGHSRIYPRRTKYALANQLLPYVGARMLVYGAAGLAKVDLSKDTPEIADMTSALQYFFEVFNAQTAQDLSMQCKSKTFDEFQQAFTTQVEKNNYMKKYFNVIEKNTKKVKLIYEMIAGGQYNVNSLKNDLKDISTAMQTKLE